ncbi:MAG TPA: amino acid adenylation domain-containing protein, partial [Steroidobacteraceae bacterium]
LQQFPLTSNGKLDRRALPAPDPGAFVSRGYQPPVSEAELDLAEIWKALLARDYVGRDDNFFELGGHSLLIVQMLEQLRRKGWSATVRSLFESPTLAALASLLRPDTATQPDIPPNLIPTGCRKITPEMLPLIALSPPDLERIVSSVPGGAENIQDIYPLTPLQEGLLFHHLVSGQGADTYVVPTLLAISSRERLDQLIAALQAVIERHDMLRTAVLWERLPQSVQVVYRHARLPVEEVTLSEHGDPATQARKWLEPARQRLDLTQAPLMKLRVAAHPGTDTWYALLQLHHLVGDNTSQEIMTAEIMAHLQGHQSQLPPALSYRDHVARALSNGDKQSAEEFFRRKLAGVTETTAPFGLLDVHGDGSRTEEAHEELDRMLTRGIRHHARRMEISPAALFHAAWALVVARTSAREDVVFGTVLLGRLQDTAAQRQPNNAGQPILGMFINTLPLRLRLTGLGARELVELTQRELVELLTHEQTSLATAQRCSGIGGSAPLFSTLLNYRHGGRSDSAGWMASEGIRVLAGRDRTNYPMTVSVEAAGERFVLTAQTDRRIDPKRITAYLRTTLEGLVRALEDSPQTLALDLPVLPESERYQLLNVFNDTRCSYPRDALIHELLEEQVTRTPDCIAVACGDQSLSYLQLNQRSNQLARYLIAQGVGPKQLVGICLERGLEMIIALFAILKAGGAYVPLDPSYPRERLSQMLADAKPKVVLTQQSLHDRLWMPVPGALSTPAIVCLDTHAPAMSNLDSSNPNPRQWGLRSSHLAYVIYTSGSTGTPKGVAIEHRNTVNLIWWARSVWNPAVLKATLLSTSLNFDLSVYECFVPLTTGGRLEIVANALSLARSHPADVTLINTVPSAIRALMDTGRIPSMTRVINLAGEPLEENVVSRIFAHSNVEQVYNLYGPTETTTYSTAITLRRESGFVRSIGRPIANTQIYVLNERRQLVPPDVTGEIYIGGDGVARGYLRRPELTAERFIPNPFAAPPVARLYKTGDLGRWNSDGTLEYLGRNDAQIKLRGFRIELGDIETSLSRHPFVKDVVVTARESDVDTGKRLVAYVIPNDPTLHDENVTESLRAHLRRVLPDYMIPNAFVLLDQFPLTPNGKVDRRALPASARSEAADGTLLKPTGKTEELLARIWSRLLSVERIGRHDNFFELGGHSLDV